MRLQVWTGFGAGVALGGGDGLWIAAAPQAAVGAPEAGAEPGGGPELSDVGFWWVGGAAAVTIAGLPQVVVPLRLREPDFTRKLS